MKNKKWSNGWYIFTAGLLLLPMSVSAQSSSPNYRIEEGYFGTGGSIESSSPNYQARQSTGSLGVGDAASSNVRTVAGFTTPSEPFLEMAIEGPDVDFGSLSPNAPSYAASQGGACNCTFYVRSYMSYSYSVVTASQPPTSENNDSIDAKATQATASTNPNIEEFGINLVANTVPGTMGAVPVNEPDDSFADGEAATGYQTTNQYKYAPDDVIARSPATPGNQGVGKTNYTISYIIKPSNITPAGQYTMRHILIAVPSF